MNIIRNPTIFDPFYIARKTLAKSIKSISHYARGDLLDVGCGTKPYEIFFDVDKYVGLEINTSNTLTNSNHDYLYNGDVFPFKDNQFDSVLTSQVLEHSFNPNIFISEIRRVLKPNGILILTVPFIWDEHEQPFDFARYSSFGIKHILNSNNFEVIEYKKLCKGSHFIFQMINAYIFKISQKRLILNSFFTKFIFLFLNIISISIKNLIPVSEDFFLDNLVVSKNTK